MARLTLRRSARWCEEFMAEGTEDDHFLLDLTEQAPSPKSLHVISCFNVCNTTFAEAIKKFPVLEELEFSLFKNVGQQAFETVGKACPRLKRFRLSKHNFWTYEGRECNKDGIGTMTKLRSLQIFCNKLFNTGVTTILDRCPHLESLDISHCFNINMDESLRAKCTRIKILRLPRDPTVDYEFEVDWEDSGTNWDDIDVDPKDYDDYCDLFFGVYHGELDEEI